VIPPDDVLPRLVREVYRQVMDAWADRTMSEIFSLEAIKDALAEAFESRFPLAESRPWIERAFAFDRSLSWRAALKNKLRSLLLEVSNEATAALRTKVTDSIAQQP
jgi:hypothetical protein